MAKGYSIDLRERVIGILHQGGRTHELAARPFRIGEAAVHRARDGSGGTWHAKNRRGRHGR